MGKPSDALAPPSPSPLPTPLEESSSSISLADTLANAPIQRYFDDDPTELQHDDLPPLYSDDASSFRPVDPLMPVGSPEFQLQPFSRNNNDDTAYYADRRLDSDPKFLEDHLNLLALVPPRPTVHLRGTHRETVRNGDRSERKEIVDFDITLDLTHLLYEDISAQRSWSTLCTVSNFEKVRRGTVFTTRAPGFGGPGSVPEAGVPDVGEWCRRFCTSRDGLRAFSFERRVVGWDFELLRGKLENLIRATNYRGHTRIEFPLRNARVEVYNDCRTNRWRLTKWIEMLFVFTLLFLFAWPWLLLRTHRWDTVYAEWCLSRRGEDGRKRYVSLSENRWYNLWARPISRAVLNRRQGVLDQGDLLDGVDATTPPAEGLAGWVQAGRDAMGVVDRSFGWGSDS
ncbi:hypothetical protein S40288_03760 [Stachybotrys chartarum IBT 40288]|nr:hypothetical protein S40288_03760 [Stachybotrys chartarum IBT 40288]